MNLFFNQKIPIVNEKNNLLFLPRNSLDNFIYNDR